MDNDVTRRHCSFCGVKGRRGMRFGGGLGALICEACISHYHELFASPAAVKLASSPPWESMTDVEILGNLPLIQQTANEVNEFLIEWVELARSRKLSWAAIGQAMGVTRQSAWERFADRLESRRSEPNDKGSSGESA